MEKQNDIRIITTKDGSHSLELPGMDETYHSRHGAITESKYVFLSKGVDYFLENNPEVKEIRILEIGFGTGLNALLTLLMANEKKLSVRFISLEPFPVEENLYTQINYGELSGAEEEFLNLHRAEWNTPVKISDYFTLEKHITTLEKATFSNYCFDVIYFDAFAPSKQAEVWSLENLQKIYNHMPSGGIFVTYSSQGVFKRNLKAAGFEMEKLEGPPGKNDMVRGLKI